MASLTTLVSFNGSDGELPGSLIADADGDLFGTTWAGGASGDGTVFEIAKTATGYASSPTTLVNFGADIQIADANGDLFGIGYASGYSTVFEITKTTTGYARSPTTLATFDGNLYSLIDDANGDLFGATTGGASGDGMVFEIAKTATGYASNPTTTLLPDSWNGFLIDDANGDLFGTTAGGGASGDGTVFEIAKTAAGYASSPTILANFGADSLIADANGDLFGTDITAGPFPVVHDYVFEIAKTAAGYASSPTNLVDFPTNPLALLGYVGASILAADANGDLFGIPPWNYYFDDPPSAVFEIAKTATGYARSPTTTLLPESWNGFLIADGNGEVFGTTYTNGASGDGTVFEITASAPPTISGTGSGQSISDEQTIDPFAADVIADPNPGTPTETVTVTPSTTANGVLSDPNLATDHGSFSDDAYSISGSASAVIAALEGLVFTPTAHEVAPGQSVTTTFTISDTNSAGETSTATTSVIAKAVNDPPTISGAVRGQTTMDDVPIKPFSGVSIADPDVGAQDSLVITLTGSDGAATDANGTLSGSGLTKTGTGTYALAATIPATLTAALDGLTFTPQRAEVPAGSKVTTGFTLAASQASATTTTTTTTTVVVTAALNYVDGPAGGFGLLGGTPGEDIITAHGPANTIVGEGGNDIINAGSGTAVVMLGNGNAKVTLGGGQNLVVGGTGNTTVAGAPGGYTIVKLCAGNDTVQVGGTHDVIVLDTGTDVVSGTQGMAFIATGAGNDTITLGGSGSTVNAGGGSNTVTGGTGGDTFVLPAPGQGFDSITGFTETNGDVLELRPALAATRWNNEASTLGNYLKVTDDSGSTTLAIAATGSGAGSVIATLNGSGNLGLADLVSHHSLLT